MRYCKGWTRECKKEARKKQLVSDRTMICSLDLAKKNHAFHVLDGSRRPIARGSIPHSLEGIEALLAHLENIRAKSRCERIVFFMEGAAHFWMPIASLLERNGYAYRLVQNRSVSHQRHVAGQSGRKTDPVDAGHIAELASSLHFSFTQLPRDEKWILLRAYACEYQDLTDHITAEKNRIHAFLETVLPNYYDIFLDPFTPTSLALLRTLSKVRDLSEKAFITRVRTFFTGKNLQVKRCRAAYHYARSDAPWGYVEARNALSERIEAAAARLQLVMGQQAGLKDRLLHLYQEMPYRHNLGSISGSSAVGNAVLLGVLGDPKNFDDARTLVRMAGLNPGERSSGEYRGRTPITKAGRSRLRRAAVSAAMAALKSGRNSDFVRRFFYLQNRAHKPLKAMQALCACAGKYLRTAWWLCVMDATYSSEIASRGFSWAKRKQTERPEKLVLAAAQ